MSENKFAQQLSVLQEKVKFADALKAHTLVISEGHEIAKNIVPMFNLDN